MMLCKAKITQGPRNGNACKYKANEGEFCKNHAAYYKLLSGAEEQGKILCKNVIRGCRSYISEGKKSCEVCLNKEKVKDKAIIEKWRSEGETCIGCGLKPFTPAIGKKVAPVRKCQSCFEKERKAEEKREKITNFKEHHLNKLVPYYNEYTRSAKRRNKEFALTQEEFGALVTSACYYCGHKRVNEVVGIDRVNNSLGYIGSNCVPACEFCNMMKQDLTQDDFYHSCQSIIRFQFDNTVLSAKNTWFAKNKMSYDVYKKSAGDRHIEFELTSSQYYDFSPRPCYLCGNKPPLGLYCGIDRKDSDKGYTMDNCNSCCRRCNQLKNKYPLVTVINQCSLIIAKHPYKVPKEEEVDEVNPKQRWRAQEIAIEMSKPNFSQWIDLVYTDCDPKFRARLLEIAGSIKDRTTADVVEAIQKAQTSNRVAKCKASVPMRHMKIGTIQAWFDVGKYDDYYKWYSEKYGEDEDLQKMIKVFKVEWPVTREEDKGWVLQKMVTKFKNKRAKKNMVIEI